MEESFCPKCGEKISPMPVIIQKSVYQKFKEFRQARLADIRSGNTPIEIREGPRTILQVIPFSHLDEVPNIINLEQVQAERGNLQPLFSSGYNSSYSYEGYMTYDSHPPVRSHLQVFRKGGIETVDAEMISCNGNELIPMTAFESGIIETLDRHLPIQQKLGLQPPFFIALSLLDVRGYKVPTRGYSSDTRPISKQDLILDAIVIETFEVDTAKLLKPLFDTIWNASGFWGSINYKDGEWVEHR